MRIEAALHLSTWLVGSEIEYATDPGMTLRVLMDRRERKWSDFGAKGKEGARKRRSSQPDE